MSEYLPPERYGGFWLRFLALLIDTLIFEVISAPFLILAYGLDYYNWNREAGAFIEGPVELLVGWIMPAVLTVLFWRYKRATPGKMLLKMEVVDADTGETLSWGQCVLRYIGLFLAAVPCGIGLVMAAFDKRKQGLHDRFANSVVKRT